MRTTDTNGSWIDTASESTGRQGRSGTNAARVIVVFVTCLLSTPSCKGSKDSAETTAPSTAAGSASTRVSAQPAGSTPSERLLTKPRYETSACAAPPDCEKECGAGRAHACKRLADMMKLGVVEDSKERRAVLQEKACNGGVLAACSALARQYNNGEGVTLDVKKAHQLWKDACDNGWGNACGSLGLQHAYAEGIPQDFKTAEGLFKKGCELSDKNSCESLSALKQGGFPTLITFVDIAAGGAEWTGKFVQLRNVEIARRSPSDGTLRSWGGKSADYIAVRINANASPEEKRRWLSLRAPGRTLVAKVLGTVVTEGDGKLGLVVQELSLDDEKTGERLLQHSGTETP